MNVYVNRLPIRDRAWGGGNSWVKAMYDIAPALGVKFCNLNDDIDAIVIAGMDSDEGNLSAEHIIRYMTCSPLGSYAKPTKKVIIRVNENDARKNTHGVDDRLINLSKYVDGTVFVSRWLMDYFLERGWKCRQNTVIHNGVDRRCFHPCDKINNGKVNIMTAHWSDNYMKGQDVTEWLDNFVGKNSSSFTYTYIGRTKATLVNSTYVKPLFGDELGEAISVYDVCINATRFDPGPNSVLEPLACMIPTYVHVDGGGAVEFAGNDHTFSTIDELTKILTNKFTMNSYVPLEWDAVVRQYVEFIKNVSACSEHIT